MIIDLHCDLLGCVAHNKKLSLSSPETNCSPEMLEKGKVFLQVFAVAALTEKGSTLFAENQITLYKKLLTEYPVSSFQNTNKNIKALIAIENASALVEEDEPLKKAFERFEAFEKVEKILYVSFTWNHENRFGGGNDTTCGLKNDGRHFLSFLSEKNCAIDLSHTSDALAYDILEHIDKHNLTITPIASHSNFRSIQNIARNLPDDIASEIIKRKGLIGLNLVRRFVGDHPEKLFSHIDHALSLGASDNLALGSDFYGGIDIPKKLIPSISFPTFFPQFSDASKFVDLLTFLQTNYSHALVQKIAKENALAFIKEKMKTTMI